MKLVPYLVFPGTCKAAMEYYQSIFEGELSLITYKESPMDVEAILEPRIFNAELKTHDLHLKASDDLPGYDVRIGSNVSLFLHVGDKDEKRRVFEKLAVDGKVLFPLEENFGMVKDQFGTQWMLASEPKKESL